MGKIKFNEYLKEIKSNYLRNFKVNVFFSVIIILIFFAALFVRVYRLDDLLGFYYDQGRDALVIWKFIHEGKPFLIGPVTGLHGIFLGPLFYYLITPLYLIGNGNPVYPAVFLAASSAISVLVVYFLGVNMHSKTAGVVAATLSGFSFYIIYNSRWFSNPNPMLLLSTLFLSSLWLLISTKKSIWVVWSTFLAGISLQFESASAVFYLPILALILVRHYEIYNMKTVGKLIKNKDEIKLILLSAILFVATLLPQLIFNFRHENILINNFINLFFKEKAFRPLTVNILAIKIDYFWSTFTNKIYPGVFIHRMLFIATPIAALVVMRSNLKRNLILLFTIFFGVPILGITFFQGNFGNIYDYYLIGYFIPFVLLISIGLAEFSRTWIGKTFLILFLVSFLINNINPMQSILKNSMDGPTDIKLESQVQAVDWIISDAVGRGKFNLHIYVPPVIPYSYDYLYVWRANNLCGGNLCGKVDAEVPLIYTLYEQDPPHPERLVKWLQDQENIGKNVQQMKFGGITVERRERI